MLKGVATTVTVLGGAILANSAFTDARTLSLLGVTVLMIGSSGLMLPQYSQQGSLLRQGEKCVWRVGTFFRDSFLKVLAGARRLVKLSHWLWPLNWWKRRTRRVSQANSRGS